MMLQLTTKDFKYFNKFIDLACQNGESIVVTKDGKPYFKIEPIGYSVNKLSFQNVIIDDHFDNENLI